MQSFLGFSSYFFQTINIISWLPSFVCLVEFWNFSVKKMKNRLISSCFIQALKAFSREKLLKYNRIYTTLQKLKNYEKL